MVFPSVPVYLDPPNWQQQQQNHHQQQGGGGENPQHLHPPPPPATAGGTGSIRPGSMADRARLAKMPQPEAALKCPRCESTNTKFCYFNNYSLSQPRHFCKTCRRYWTRGGALRNVPVGGGCRRNKRSKGNSSKSPASSDRQTGTNSANSAANSVGAAAGGPNINMSCTSDALGHLVPSPVPPPQLPFNMGGGANLHHHHLSHIDHYNPADIGLNFPAIHPVGGGSTHHDMDFQMGGGLSSGAGAGGSILSAGSDQQWRIPQVQQFPFMTGLEPPPALYPFEGDAVEHPYGGGGGSAAHLRAKAPPSSVNTQMAPVKVEGNDIHGLNMQPRQFLAGISGNDHQYWGVNAWNDLSGFTSASSSSHML